MSLTGLISLSQREEPSISIRISMLLIWFNKESDNSMSLLFLQLLLISKQIKILSYSFNDSVSILNSVT